MTKTLKGIVIEKHYCTQKERWTENSIDVIYTPTSIRKGILKGECIINFKDKSLTIEELEADMCDDMRYAIHTSIKTMIETEKILRLLDDESAVYKIKDLEEWKQIIKNGEYLPIDRFGV